MILLHRRRSASRCYSAIHYSYPLYPFLSEKATTGRKQPPWMFTSGCSLFARFSVSTVRLEPSEKTTTERKHPPSTAPAHHDHAAYTAIVDLIHQMAAMCNIYVKSDVDTCTYIFQNQLQPVYSQDKWLSAQEQAYLEFTKYYICTILTHGFDV